MKDLDTLFTLKGSQRLQDAQLSTPQKPIGSSRLFISFCDMQQNIFLALGGRLWYLRKERCEKTLNGVDVLTSTTPISRSVEVKRFHRLDKDSFLDSKENDVVIQCLFSLYVNRETPTEA